MNKLYSASYISEQHHRLLTDYQPFLKIRNQTTLSLRSELLMYLMCVSLLPVYYKIN